MPRVAAIILVLFLPLSAAAWPTNVITVTDSTDDADCVADNNPRECCAGNAAHVDNSCDGMGGEDILDGLVLCQIADGCILDLPEGDYENAETDIDSGAPVAGSFRNGIALTTGFQNGLIIRGRGNGTHLKSRIPPARYDGSNSNARAGIFWIAQWNPVGVPIYGFPKIAIENLQLDGQSNLQPSDDHTDAALEWDDGNEYATFHIGIQFRIVDPTPNVVVRNVWSHHFTGAGIQVSRASHGLITGNTVNNIGCWQDFSNAVVCTEAGSPFTLMLESDGVTPVACCTGLGTGTCDVRWWSGVVAGEVECGADSGQPHKYQWDIRQEQNAASVRSPGDKIGAGFGIRHNNAGNVLISNNTVSYSTKYGIICDAGSQTAISTDLCRINGNTLTDAVIFSGTHSTNEWISNNTVTASGKNGELATSASAIAASGDQRRLWILDNTVASEGPGISIRGGVAYPGVRRGMRVEGNTIANSGAWSEIESGGSSPGHSNIVFRNAVSLPCSEAELHPSSTEVINNTVTNTNDGTAALTLGDHATDCAGGFFSPLTISGNNFYPPISHTTVLANVKGLGITSTSQTLQGGVWTWLLGSTGTCSGWTKNGGSSVTDSSGNGIGTC